jgi:predicted RNase H-like HicB family nuclease
VEEALRNAKESLELALEVPAEDDLERVELLNVDHVVVGAIEVEVPELAAARD